MARKPVPLDNLAEVGKRLKEARLSTGFTQKQVGQQLGIAQSSINRWETGKDEPPPGGLVALATLYAVSIDWLLTGHDPCATPVVLAPIPGQAIIRLPRGDPEPLSDDHADLLEKAVVVLRAEGSAEHYAGSLAANIDSSYKGVLQARLLEGPAGLKAANGDS